MKRFILLLLCLSFVLSLVSCTFHPFMGAKEGEYPKHCIRAEFRTCQVEIAVGESFDSFLMFIPWEAVKHNDKSIEHIDVEFTVDPPDVVEIVSYDVDQLLNHDEDDGLTIKGLKPGVATITMTFIYKPTGGRFTSKNAGSRACTVTVVDPTETAE